MKKKVAVMATMAMMICGIGNAAPLTDYSVGKTTIDMTWRSADINGKNQGDNADFGNKKGLDWGITTGLGNNFAIQYSDYNVKSKEAVLYQDATETFSMKSQLKTQEINVLYKLNDNLSAYTGLVRLSGNNGVKDVLNNVTTEQSFDMNTKNKIQFGLVGSTKIADKTTAYAQVGVASDYTNWKIGLSQEIAPNIELNLDYRRLEAKELRYSGTNNSIDATIKGFGFGATYKF